MRNTFLVIIFLLSACGYQPLYSNKNTNEFTFKEIEYRGDKNISRSVIFLLIDELLSQSKNIFFLKIFFIKNYSY